MGFHLHGHNFQLVHRSEEDASVWLFHCHIGRHMDQGLIATIEVPAQIQDPEVPKGHLTACDAGKVPHRGNAVGNPKGVLDLRVENRPPPALPEGFTAKGYVALVASCVSAFIGLATIAWYGTIGMNKKEDSEESQQRRGRKRFCGHLQTKSDTPSTDGIVEMPGIPKIFKLHRLDHITFLFLFYSRRKTNPSIKS